MAKKILFRTGGTWADSVVSNGITWTFSAPALVGQFVTGDYWVVGPVTVQSVSPAPTGIGTSYRNGSMVNPDPTGHWNTHYTYQGLDGRCNSYTSGLSITYPYSLLVGQSLLSCEYAADGNHVDVTGNTNSAPSRNCLKQAAVLTCLGSVPSIDAFRPAYVGTNKTLHRASQINWSILPNLTPTSGIRSQATYESWVTKPWIDFLYEYVTQQIHPYLNMPVYGGDLSGAIGEAALFTCCNYTQAQKQATVYGIIQIGIDNYYSMLINDDMRPVNGGHNIGRKLPIIYAGKLLGQSSFLTASYHNQEDESHYLGTSKSPTHTLWTGWQDRGHKYSKNVLKCFGVLLDGEGMDGCWEHIHPSLWGQSPFPWWSKWPWDTSSHEGYLRFADARSVSSALAARIIGAKTSWNHDAFFDGIDRWMYETNDETIRNTIMGYWWSPNLSHPPATGSLRSVGDWWVLNCESVGAWSEDLRVNPHGGTWDPFTASMWAAYRESYDG